MKSLSLLTNDPNLAQTFPNVPNVTYRKEKSLKDLLVRAKIKKSQQTIVSTETQAFSCSHILETQ